MLRISNVYKSYKDNNVLKGINLEISSGEIVGLIGKNGSGKTTLIKVILGSIIADSGIVQYKDQKNYTSERVLMEEIGYLLDIELPQELNAVDLLKLFFLYENKKYNLNSINSMLEAFKLPKNKKIKKYSYGMQQRLRLLIALEGPRKLLILDEPLLGLDILSIDLMKNRLKKFVSHGGSIFLSSHQLAEIQDIVNRYVVLEEGTIIDEFIGNSVIFELKLKDRFNEFNKLIEWLNEQNISFQTDSRKKILYVQPESLNKVLQKIFNLNLEVEIEQKSAINQSLLRESQEN